jgi:hypothetical protein
MQKLFAYLGVEDRELQSRFTRRLYTAICSTLAQWVLLHTGRKNDVKVAEKRLPLMKVEDGYTLQYCHLATENGESVSPVADQHTVGSQGDV